MNSTERDLITQYVKENIDHFHGGRLTTLANITLHALLKRKDPYLFRAKNLLQVQDLVPSLLDAYLSSSEEQGFGQFLEGLAIFVSSTMCGGQKSAAAGLDLELTRADVRYVVAVKSGPNWGNSGQYADLETKFKRAKQVLSQNRQINSVQPILGMCYGKSRTTNTGLYIKMYGQAFWEFISGDPNLYIDLIEPIGYEASSHDENYKTQKSAIYNRFIPDFAIEFCDVTGNVNWPKLLQFNSGNLHIASPS